MIFTALKNGTYRVSDGKNEVVLPLEEGVPYSIVIGDDKISVTKTEYAHGITVQEIKHKDLIESDPLLMTDKQYFRYGTYERVGRYMRIDILECCVFNPLDLAMYPKGFDYDFGDMTVHYKSRRIIIAVKGWET